MSNNPNTTGRFGSQPAPTPEELAKQQAAAKKLEEQKKDDPVITDPLKPAGGSKAFALDQDVNLSEGNMNTGVIGSLTTEQILALQKLNEATSGSRMPFPTDGSADGTQPEGFYSVGKGYLRCEGKVYPAEKLGGRFYYDPKKLPEAAIRQLATFLKSGVVTVVAEGVSSDGTPLDVAE